MQRKSRRAAWWQAMVLVAVAVLVAGTLVTRLQRPFDADTLSIPVGELRSNAAEARLLVLESTRGRVAPAFVRHHAQQLRHAVERTRDTLDARHAQPAQEPLRRDALALADALNARLDALARDAGAPAASATTFGALADAIDALDRRIKPDA